MKSWRAWVAGLATVVLAGCGGGGDGGTPIVGPAPSPTASDLVLVLSETTIPNTGATTVDATVTAVDKNNNAVANVPVTIKVNANATVEVTAARTGTDGKIVGKVSIGSDRSLRTITVTVESAGIASKSATLQVIDASSGGVPKAADLTLTLSSATLQNAGTQTVIVTAVAVDVNRNTVAAIPVTLAVNSGATIKVSSNVTNSDGKVTGEISIGDDKSNRAVTVTATSGTLVRTANLQIIGAQIKSTLLPAVMNVGQTAKIQYTLLDSSSNPIPRKQITVSGPGGVQTTGTSDINGEFEFAYVAPGTAGELQIRASALGVENLSTVLVQSGAGTVPVVTTPVQSASVSANPNVVAVNTGITKNQATIRALFLGALNAPIPNVRVRFDLDGDAQSIGGVFTSGATMVYSDASGIATTSYVPGARFSPTNGVTVRACWDYGDFAAGACPNAARATLTVIADSLSVTLGTNLLIGEDDSKLKYVTRYVAQVVDSSGLAAADVQVSASVDLLLYYKGFYELDTINGIQRWTKRTKETCDNEDVNRNGVSEVFSNGNVEDANNSFNLTNGRAALEPRKADVALSYEGSSKTNASGIVILRLEYPKDVASWVRFNLVVAASGVAGTEGRSNFVGDLPVPAAVVNKFDESPPFVKSPYGIENSPKTSISEPGSTRPASVVCQNPN